ncbi:MAG: acyl-coenzyme A thioesterase PaaI-like protein [Paracoccaceae bacterium]|jgi:acyl-coenzyme A thioesterase PaaI-like protein
MNDHAVDFGIDKMAALLGQVFAPWVQDLGLRPVSAAAHGARFVLPGNARLARGGGDGPGVVCGQALASAADTASVVTLASLNGRFRNCTTVDLTVHFLRPLPVGDIEVDVEALSNGRRMATTRVEFRAVGGGKLAATATCAFAYLED